MKSFFSKNKGVFSLIALLLFFNIFVFVNINKDPEDYKVVVIGNGDTLWNLASDYEGHYRGTKEHFIKWVEKNNSIGNVENLKVGQEIIIPVDRDKEVVLNN